MHPLDQSPLCPRDQRQALARLLAIALQRLLPESDLDLPEYSQSRTNEDAPRGRMNTATRRGESSQMAPKADRVMRSRGPTHEQWSATTST